MRLKIAPRAGRVAPRAPRVGRRRAEGDAETVDRSAPFAGVPFLLKELATGWAGAPQTNSSRFLQDLVAPADDERAARIRRAGFLLLGKSNAPENGWSIATEPKLYGVTKNPWKDGITPGGSSGGTAATSARTLSITRSCST